MNYYFVGTLLPDLKIGNAPEMSLREFDRLMQENLSDNDYKKIKTIRNFYDIPNLRAYWKDEPFSSFGNLNYAEMEEALVTKSILPKYIFDFLEKYETKDERIKHYPELLASFFHHEIKNTKGAIKADLILERDLRLILVAFRAKLLGRDLYKELQYEDPEDEIVAQILAAKDAAVYEPPEKYEGVKRILLEYADDPIGLHKALYEYRFDKIEEMLGLDFFSVERFVGYMIQLIMVERWQQLDREKGQKIVNGMLKEAS